MTAATYDRFPHHCVRYVRPFRWDWEVTDGIGGHILTDDDGKPLAGHRWTRGSAQLDAAIAAALSKPSPRLVLEQRLSTIVGQLDRQGLQVEVSIDERDRVCVRPLCACTTWDRVRIARAFLAITAHVALACTKHESPVGSCEWCRCFSGAAQREVSRG